MGIGLLLLRVVIGALFIGHGTQKLFGWFGGRGPEGTAQFLESLDYRRPHQMARVGGAAEAGAGLLLVLGLLTPFAAAAILGVMINAIATVHLRNGVWNTQGGLEYPLVLATAAVMFGFAGPGAAAIDPAIGIAGPGWGLVTLVLGVTGAIAVLFMREDDELVIHSDEESAAPQEKREAA